NYVADGNARFNGLRSGTYDASFLTAPLDAQATQLGTEFQTIRVPFPSPNGILVNTKTGLFTNPLMRKAVQLAVDRKAMSHLTNDIDPPDYQTFMPGFVGYDPSLNKDIYNPKKAAKLVQQAGAQGATVTVLQSSGQSPVDQMAQVFQQELQAIGLTAKLVPTSPATLIPTWSAGANDLAVYSIVGRVDPTSTMNVAYLGGRNIGTPPDALVTMANKGQVAPYGSAERAKDFQDVSKYLIDNPIHVPVIKNELTWAAVSNLVGAQNLLSAAGIFSFRNMGLAKA